jgi:heme O synthase-like polyprenyltransferase
MAFAVAGTALVAGGAAVLNQVYERDTDALMRRTRMRPLPDSRVAASDARIFGIAISTLGLVMLAARANLLAAALALATLVVT